MRNTNWTIIALALLAAAGIFYFMKQSDFMKTQSVATEAAEMETSMDVQEPMLGEEDEPFEEEGVWDDAWNAEVQELLENEPFDEEDPYLEKAQIRIIEAVRAKHLNN